MGQDVCLSDMHTKLPSKFASSKRALQFLGFALGLAGSDICISFPGLGVDSGTGDVLLGFVIKGTFLDPSKVTIDPVWTMFPTSYTTVINALQSVMETEYSIPGSTCDVAANPDCPASGKFTIKSFLTTQMRNGVKSIGTAQNIDIDFCKIFGTLPALAALATTTGDIVTLKFLKVVNPGSSRRRRLMLGAQLPNHVSGLQETPQFRPSHRVWIPNGATTEGHMNAAELRRRLAIDYDWNLGSGSAIFTDDSHCEFTLVGT